MSDAITMLDPDTSQFSTLLMKLNRNLNAVGNVKMSWLEDDLFPRFRRDEWFDVEWEGWETKREQWERRRDEALSHFRDFVVVSRGEALWGVNPAYFRVGDIVRNTQTGEAMTVTVLP